MEQHDIFIPTGMRIQFRTLTFHSRLEEQLQEHIRLKKSVTSLPAMIEALGFPLVSTQKVI
jgi:hypothetical protein